MNKNLSGFTRILFLAKLSCRLFILLIPLTLCFLSCKVDPDIIDTGTLGQWIYYDSLSGLSSNFIWSIFQDREGNIWAGTNDHGVSKFNGNQWINYNINDGLASNSVYAIAQDKDDDMWFGSEGGMNLLIGEVIYVIDSIDGVPFIPITLFHDSEQRMWAGTPGYGLVVFSGNNYNYQPISFQAREEFNIVNAFAEDKAGTIWIGTSGGAIYYRNDEFEAYDSVSGLYSNEVSYMLQDSWGDLWFATINGEFLTRYDGVNSECIGLYHGYIYAYTYSMSEDRKGNIWFASGPAGIVKYNGLEMYTLELPDRFRNDSFLCSMTDRDGNIWFGTMNNGIVVYISE